MAGSKKKKRSHRRKSRSGPKNKNISSLLAAAAALPCVGLESSLFAQSVPEETTFGFQYAYYLDWQEGNVERMKIKTPMVWFNTAVGENTEVEGGFVLDTVSGASALFHDTLTGASGSDIEDERHAGDISVTRYFDDFSVGLGANYSSEDDYDSQGGNLVFKKWSSDKNTVFIFGASANHDRVRSTNNPNIDELRRAFGGIIGVTQVVNKNSLVQSNLSYDLDDGYLTDPYKLRDNRPSSRDKVAWLTRYVRYVPSYAASLHTDYRYYRDSWDIDSHTFEVRWYQPLDDDEKWLLRPRLRYYSQSKAKFYSNTFPPDADFDGFYTTDYRLSGYGSLTTGLKLIRDFGDKFSASVSANFIATSSGWKLGSPGSPGLDDLYAAFVTAGFTKRF